jgi:hypothetical protein
MKKIITLTIIAALLAIVPQAQANGGRHTAAIGGFAAGAVVMSMFSGDRHEHHRERCYRPEPIYVERPLYIERTVYVERPRGHYEQRWQQFWIDGRQLVTINAYGDRTVRYEPGHYEIISVNVWVE